MILWVFREYKKRVKKGVKNDSFLAKIDENPISLGNSQEFWTGTLQKPL
jgi:hypothetical protein